MKKVSVGGARDSASHAPQRTTHPSPLAAVGLKKHQTFYKDLDTTSMYVSSSSSSSSSPFVEEGSTKICGAGIIKAFKKTCGASNTTKSTYTSGRSPAPPAAAPSSSSSSSSSSRSVSSSISAPVSIDAFIDDDANNVIKKGRSSSNNVAVDKKKHAYRPASSSRRRGGRGRPGKILECLLFLDMEQEEVKKNTEQQQKTEQKQRYQQQKTVRREPAMKTGTTPSNTTTMMAPKTSFERKTTDTNNQCQNPQGISPVTKAPPSSSSSSRHSGSEENKVVKSTTTRETTTEEEGEKSFFTFDDDSITVPSCNIVVSKVSSRSFEGEQPISMKQKKSPSSMTPSRMGRPPRPPMSPSTNLSHIKQTSVKPSPTVSVQASPAKTSLLSPINISSYSNASSCSYGAGADDDEDDDGVVQIDPSVIKSRIAEIKKLQQLQQKSSGDKRSKHNIETVDGRNSDENQLLDGQQSLLVDHSTRSDRAVNAAMTKILKAMAVNIGGDDDDFGSITSAEIGGEDFDGRLSTLLDISTRRGARSCFITQSADFEDIMGNENCPHGSPTEHSADPQSHDNDKLSTEFEHKIFDRIENKEIRDEDTNSAHADVFNEKETIASLKEERESYKSEAMSLREEIEMIKDQLAEFRHQLSISATEQTGTVPSSSSSSLLHVNKKYQQYPDVKNCQTEDSYMGDDSIQNSFLQCQSKSERTERKQASTTMKAIPSSLSPIIGSVSSTSTSSSSISDDDYFDDSVRSETLHSQYPLPYGIQPRGY